MPYFNKNHIVSGDYDLQFYIGEISCGETYRAKSKNGELVRLNIYNAAKLKAEHYVDDEEFFEAKLLKNIKNPNIVEYNGHGDFIEGHNKFVYVAYKFISGETLAERFKREGCFSPYEAIPIIVELLLAIEYLHSLEKPVLHNAYTMDNIVLDYSENRLKPVLINFQNARFFTGKIDSTQFNNVLSHYLAPEVYNNVATPQSDLFIVGALLYHMMVGVPPWHVDIPKHKISNNIVKKEVENARNKPLVFTMTDENLIDDHIKSALNKALALDVDARFKSASEFSSVLRRETEVQAYSSENKRSPDKKQYKPRGNKQGGFSDIAGMKALKATLYNDVIRAMNEPELYESYGITIPNGMLLYGPPGCGKTYVSEKLSEEIGFNFIQLKPSDIKSKYINETEQIVGGIFKQATENSPSVIFFDEIDSIVPSRDNELNQMHASVVNELLAQMTNCSEKGIFIIAATNRPEKIDTAIIRTGRIDRVIYLPPPDLEARECLFKLYLDNRPVDLSVNYETLSELTKNYVTSDIKYLVDEASRGALKLKSKITQELLESAIQANSPSISLNELNKYEAMREKFENDRKGIEKNSKANQKKNPIGFIH